MKNFLGYAAISLGLLGASQISLAAGDAVAGEAKGGDMCGVSWC